MDKIIRWEVYDPFVPLKVNLNYGELYPIVEEEIYCDKYTAYTVIDNGGEKVKFNSGHFIPKEKFTLGSRPTFGTSAELSESDGFVGDYTFEYYLVRQKELEERFPIGTHVTVNSEKWDKANESNGVVMGHHNGDLEVEVAVMNPEKSKALNFWFLQEDLVIDNKK